MKFIKSVIHYLVSRFTMKCQRVLFWDKCNGMAVCLYTDKYGDEWLAQGKFGFRCNRKDEVA